MKKLLFCIVLVALFLVSNVQAAVVNLSTDGEFQEYINKIGFKILNCNEIEHHMIFKYSSSEAEYSTFDSQNMSVEIPKGILLHVEAEDELAAVIANQIAYGIMNKENSFSKMNIKIAPKKYETLADKISVDLLVNAGYSPIAAITMINKTYGEKNNSAFSKHVSTSVRLANIYEYIVRKYPEKLENNRFTKNIYYQNFLLTSRKNREILQNKLTTTKDTPNNYR